jgi:hypothetical protein
MAKIKCLKSQMQMQCKKKGVFVDFDYHDTKYKTVIWKYHSACLLVVAHAC